MPEEHLINAVYDYRYLLDRNYSQRASIKLVGDRYMLKREERSILYRGISDSLSAKKRKAKKARAPENTKVYIDAYNIIFTLANYLNGRPIFVADDGFLRDAGELRGRISNSRLMERISFLLLTYFKENNGNNYLLYLDKPVSNSGKLSWVLNEQFSRNKLNAKSQICDSPDHIIINTAKKSDIVCSSDSIIIDKVPCPVFDLSHHLINKHFNPEILDLGKFIDENLPESL